MKTFTSDFHPQSPIFAAFASLREIFRDLLAASLRCVAAVIRFECGLRFLRMAMTLFR